MVERFTFQSWSSEAISYARDVAKGFPRGPCECKNAEPDPGALQLLAQFGFSAGSTCDSIYQNGEYARRQKNEHQASQKRLCACTGQSKLLSVRKALSNELARAVAVAMHNSQSRIENEPDALGLKSAVE